MGTSDRFASDMNVFKDDDGKAYPRITCEMEHLDPGTGKVKMKYGEKWSPLSQRKDEGD